MKKKGRKSVSLAVWWKNKEDYGSLFLDREPGKVSDSEISPSPPLFLSLPLDLPFSFSLQICNSSKSITLEI